MKPWRSKKLLALALCFAAAMLWVVVAALAGSLVLIWSLPWVLTGIFATTIAYVLAQGYADAKTDGKTSGVVQQPITHEQAKAEIKAATMQWLQERAGQREERPPGS